MARELKDELDELSESILIQQEVAGAHALEESEELLQGIAGDITRLTLDSAYRRHILTYLKQERERFVDGERTAPLCSCTNPFCDLKEGKIPSRVLLADTVDAGITDYLAQHNGDAHVLDEAREEWIGQCGEVKQTMRQALAILRRDERPEDDEGEETAAEDDADPAEVEA